MSDYVFDSAGEPVEVLAATAGWRVKKVKPRGAPETVYGRNGQPLVLQLRWTADELHHEVRGDEGKYRLEPVDEAYRSIEGAQSTYFYLHADAAVTAPRAVPDRSDGGAFHPEVVELARLNTELAKTVVCQFPAMMDSAAAFLRAGAGLPTRPPIALPLNENETSTQEEEDGEEEAAPPTGNNLTELVAQYLPLVLAKFTGASPVEATGGIQGSSSGAPQTPHVARKGGRSSTASTVSAHVPASPRARPNVTAQAASSSVPSHLPQLSPTEMAHFIALQQQLTPEERVLAQGVLAQLRPDEVQAWISELSGISLPAALERIRALLHGPSQTTVVDSEAAS